MNTPECRIYTAKVLSNGRLLRWTQAATYGEMEPEGIHQITGDTPMRQGEHLLNTAKIALATPDGVVATATPSGKTLIFQMRFLNPEEQDEHAGMQDLHGQSPVQRPAPPLDTGSNIRGNGARGHSSDHRRHPHAPGEIPPGYCKNSPRHPGWGGRNCNSFR